MAENEMAGYTPVETKEYASKGMAGTALGIAIGAGVNSLINGNGLGGIFGGRPMPPPPDFLPRSEALLMQELANKNAEIAKLEAVNIANAKTDEVRRELQAQITVNKDLQAKVNLDQATVNATQTGLIAGLQAQLAQLQGCFKMMIPSGNVVPAPTA